MDEQNVRLLNYILDDLRESQENVSDTITTLLNQVSSLEKQLDSVYNLSFVLSALREKVESVDVDTIFGFIDDLEAEVNSLLYNYKQAEKANGISVYKVTSKQTPIYLKQTF